MRFNTLTKLCCLSLLVSLAACESKEDDSTSAATESTPLGTATTTTTSADESTADAAVTKLKTAESVGDLNLAGTLNIELPAAFSGGAGASLNLSGAPVKFSQESCQMGATIKEVTERMASISNFFCHIEQESDKIKFGKKYRIMASMGGSEAEFGKIYIDNSELAAGKLTLGFCSNGAAGDGGPNQQLITISGISEDGARGQMVDMGEHEEQSWHSSISFDMTEEGKVVMVAKQKHSSSGDNSFNRLVELSLDADGVSEVSLASAGVWENSGFEDIGFARFDADHGSSIYNSFGSHQGFEYEFIRRSYFDSAGYVAAEADSASFAAGGSLYVSVDDLPEPLAEDFSPDSITGWLANGCDAAEVEEDLSLDPESAAHQACDGDESHDFVDCWDQETYQQGSEVQ